MAGYKNQYTNIFYIYLMWGTIYIFYLFLCDISLLLMPTVHRVNIQLSTLTIQNMYLSYQSKITDRSAYFAHHPSCFSPQMFRSMHIYQAITTALNLWRRQIRLFVRQSFFLSLVCLIKYFCRPVFLGQTNRFSILQNHLDWHLIEFHLVLAFSFFLPFACRLIGLLNGFVMIFVISLGILAKTSCCRWARWP